MQTVQSLIFLVLLIGIFYFMLVRPQKKRVQQHNNLLESIGIGDEIVTIGGLHGTVRSIGDEDVEIEAAPGVKMRFVKNAIARRVSEDLEDDDTTSNAPPPPAPEALETTDTTETTETEVAEPVATKETSDQPASTETSEDEKS